MICIVLAAGYATRLYPLTENFPKPLLKVGEKTIMDWLLDDIDATGTVSRYIVVSNHRYAEHFRSWAAEKRLPVDVIDDGSVSNETRLGAVKDIQFAIDWAHADDDLLVIAGDNVLDFSLRHFIDFARGRRAPCVMRFWQSDREKLKKWPKWRRTGGLSAWRKSPPSPLQTGACRRFIIIRARTRTMSPRPSGRAAASTRPAALLRG